MPALADPLRVATGAPALLRRLTTADAELRRAVPTSRRVSILQADGGAGATTATARLGAALAVRRHGEVLLVDAARGGGALAAAAGLSDPPSLAHAARRAVGATRAGQLRDLGPRTASGLLAVGDGAAPATRADWVPVISGAGRFFDVVLTDWGVRDLPQGREVAASSHAVAVLARADRGPAERGLALAAALAADGAAPVHLVLVDIGGTGGASAAVVADLAPVPVLRLPHVAALGTGGAAAARLGLSARAAYAAAAAALLRASLGEAA